MRTRPYLIVLILICFKGFAIESNLLLKEQISDTLQKLPFKKLSTLFFENEVSTPKQAKMYANAFIKKAKKNNNTIKLAKGYCLMSYVSNKVTTVKYLDSVILITKNSTDKSYPTQGYLLKGYYYYQWGNYRQSLNNFIKAYPIAIKKNNIEDQLYIQNHIAILKNRWGDVQEALVIYKEVLEKIKNLPNYKENKSQDYLTALYNLSLSYIKNKDFNSASTYINEGIKESLILNDSSMYNSFVFTAGIKNYNLKEYNTALDSINKAIPNIESETSLAIANYYKGKIFYDKNLNEKSIEYFLKVDSIFTETQDEFPELTDNYQILTTYYKQNKQFKKQLHYIEKLLYVDSILDLNYIDINRMLVKKYDIPLLLKEKNTIIKNLNNKDRISDSYIILLSLFCALSLLIIFYLKKRNRNYIQRFNVLMQNDNTSSKLTNNSEIDRKNTLKISNEVIESILTKLEKFEKNNGFCNTEISVQKLAKKLNTNANYLSKIINTYKGKSFSNYINELRVNYAINKLKHDKNFRKYTIEAIANDSGFKKAQSFATAFNKKTGINPSYFINNLKKS